ncbi:hypothetical protein HPB50_003533 [Hyalomma asiaticum]|uniref:Uncharacterized protein n=1 Tax=Hyalomma asiaticum TaxID=266040 RepID=A0ACB7SM86_HYAAI|nr:hypothetical protein HPB50_003533 [Hyalomma asiaticum]
MKRNESGVSRFGSFFRRRTLRRIRDSTDNDVLRHLSALLKTPQAASGDKHRCDLLRDATEETQATSAITAKLNRHRKEASPWTRTAEESPSRVNPASEEVARSSSIKEEPHPEALNDSD